MAWGKGGRMGRIWPIRFPCVLLTMGMIPPPPSIHCYHKGNYRNTIGVCSGMYTWVWGVESVYTPSSLNLVMTTLNEMLSFLQVRWWRWYQGIAPTLGSIFREPTREALFKVKLQSWVFLKTNREILLGYTTRSCIISPLAELRRLFWIPVFFRQILVLKGLKRKSHF